MPSIRQLSIVDKSGREAKLKDVINWAQIQTVHAVERRMNAGLPVRAVVLKARQLGLSTIIEAIMFVLAFELAKMRGLVISHDLDSSEHLLGITTNYWDTYPYKALYTEKYRGAKRLSWDETGAFLRIATAANAKSGRSQTLHFVHASEVAFYEKPSQLMTGLLQAVPDIANSFVFMESTANGVGNYFHQQWLAAESGQSDFMPLFFPWYKHPEYVLTGHSPLGRLDEEERILKKFFGILGMEDGEVVARLVWRRYTIRNKLKNSVDDFHQEYPTTPEEAFLSTGRNVFPAKHLKVVYQPMKGIQGRIVKEGSKLRFQEDIFGPLTVFKWPAENNEWGQYVVAGDPTRTTMGDYACMQVINRRTWEQVAVWRAKVDPTTFGHRIGEVGKFYNHALVNTEIEGPGYATIGALVTMNYPYLWERQQADREVGETLHRFGWSSTNKTKPEMIGNLLKMVVDHDIVIHHEQTFHEMLNFVDLGAGQYGNGIEEEHDDTVSSLAIAMMTTLYEASALMAYGAASARTEDQQPERPAWMEWGEEVLT